MIAVDAAATPLIICLLGPFAVHVNGVPLPRLRARKGEALLALLVLRHGQEVQRSWLAGMLWPDCSESQGLATLRRYLTDLRQVLGAEAGRLASPTKQLLRLDLTGATVDVLAFDAALARGDPASLEEAITHYRGPLLEGWEEEWVFQEREAREQAYLQALERLAEQALTGKDLGAAERYLRRAAAVDPLRESAQRALMQALTAGGNYAAALQAYRDLRLLLHREMNAEPDAETTALFQKLRTDARRQTPPSAGSSPSPASPPHPLPEPPTAEGTLTFLFTDIEGSSQLWEQHPVAMRDALSRHDLLLRQAIEAHDGTIFKTMGDQFCAAFATAPDALGAALAAQQALVTEAWGATGPLRVRMALHTGTAQQREGDYFGPPLNRVARLLSAGHGGQILLSWVTQELAREQLPAGTGLLDLGEHRLKDLARAERIFQVVGADLSSEFPPLDTLERRRHHLPVQPTPLIGREKELQAALACLQRDAGTGEGPGRLLTLTGPGGTGKTRLGLQIAAELLDEFPDGVFFVNLAPITDPALVLPTIAHILEVREVGNRSLQESLTEYLREKQLLLVLDNYEQVIAAAPLVADLLAASPGLKVLATSREALHLRGEQEFPVPPLAQPDLKRLPAAGAALVAALSHYAAMELFIQRAVAVKPEFVVTNENAPAVAEICARLDGLPLAIELAAARVKLFPPAALLSRLSQPLKLLTGGARDLPIRQQTLRGTIAWSYDLLEEGEKALFRRLSVFAGGAALESAEAVCDAEGDLFLDVLDGIASLVGKSLLQQEETIDGEPRFVMLETIREFGRDCLAASGEAAAIRDQHCAYLLQLTEAGAAPDPDESFGHLYRPEGEGRVEYMETLEREHDNLREALNWATETGDEETGLRLAAAATEFWWTQGYLTEARERVARLLPLLEGAGQRAARVRALLLAAGTAHLQGDRTTEAQLFEELLAIRQELGDKPGIAACYAMLGFVSRCQGDYARARTFLEQSLAVCRELGDKGRIAVSLYGLGYVSYLQGDLQPAAAVLEESLGILRAVGDRDNSGWVLAHLGEIADARADYSAATAYLEESLAIWRAQDHKLGQHYVLHHLGRVAKHQGDWQAARARFAESLKTVTQVHEVTTNLLTSLVGLAEVAGVQGEPERATRLLGAIEALEEAGRCTVLADERVDGERCAAAARTFLGEEAFAAAWAEGRAMALEQAVAYALQEDG